MKKNRNIQKNYYLINSLIISVLLFIIFAITTVTAQENSNNGISPSGTGTERESENMTEREGEDLPSSPLSPNTTYVDPYASKSKLNYPDFIFEMYIVLTDYNH